MELISTGFDEVKILRPRRFEDERGYFCETFNAREMASVGVDMAFVQDNQSLSTQAGTLRGLHFQAPPYAQHKLVRVIRGKILDVVVDIREGSPRFGRHVTVTLEPRSGQLSVPIGFAHGFCTLEPDTEIAYKASKYYSPDHDRGIIWDDPEIGIDWPFGSDDLVLSAKDKVLPRLRDIDLVFTYAARQGG